MYTNTHKPPPNNNKNDKTNLFLFSFFGVYSIQLVISSLKLQSGRAVLSLITPAEIHHHVVLQKWHPVDRCLDQRWHQPLFLWLHLCRRAVRLHLFLRHLAVHHVRPLWPECGQEADPQVMDCVPAGYPVHAHGGGLCCLYDSTECEAVWQGQ